MYAYIWGGVCGYFSSLFALLRSELIISILESVLELFATIDVWILLDPNDSTPLVLSSAMPVSTQGACLVYGFQALHSEIQSSVVIYAESVFRYIHTSFTILLIAFFLPRLPFFSQSGFAAVYLIWVHCPTFVLPAKCYLYQNRSSLFLITSYFRITPCLLEKEL
jgi:hypothetical protein